MATETRQRAERYIDLLLERIELCKYPSRDLMDRLERTIVMFWEEEREDRHEGDG